MIETEIISILKVLLLIVGVNLLVTLALLFGLVTCFCLIRTKKKQIKVNRDMIRGLDVSMQRIIEEYLEFKVIKEKMKEFMGRCGFKI